MKHLINFVRVLFKKQGLQKSAGTTVEPKAAGRRSGRGMRFLYCTPEFELDSRMNKAVVRAIYRELRDDVNITQLKLGKTIKKAGFQIRKEATGSYKGGSSTLTLKVSFAEKELFVKICKGRRAESWLKTMQTVEDFLKTRKHRINNFNVFLIPAMLLYDEAVSNKSYLVSRFYKKNEARLVSDLSYTLIRNINENVLTIVRNFCQAYDIGPVNAFYFPKSRSIGLFDVKH